MPISRRALSVTRPEGAARGRRGAPEGGRRDLGPRPEGAGDAQRGRKHRRGRGTGCPSCPKLADRQNLPLTGKLGKSCRNSGVKVGKFLQWDRKSLS